MTFTYFQGHSKVENIQFKIVYFLSKFWSDWAQTLCAGSCYIYMNNIVHKVFFVTLAYIFNWTSLGKNLGVGFLSDAASMWDLWNSAGWSLSLSFTHDSYRFTWPWPIFEGHRRVEKYWKWYIFFLPVLNVSAERFALLVCKGWWWVWCQSVPVGLVDCDIILKVYGPL